MIAFLSATFLSAFLLFQVQPVIARFILPLYGGSPALWTASMMFFQVALLLGYLYAHLLGSKLDARTQPLVHALLLALSVLFLPIGPPESWVPAVNGRPGVEILGLLAVSVGGPFTLVAASGPLLQRWFASIFEGRSPFRLYALSNLGSLLGLLSYPFLIEPNLKLAGQTFGWSVAYVVLIALFLACGVAFRQATVHGQDRKGGESRGSATWGDRLLWVSLAACGSVLLLSITSRISQDIAVVPFLWVIPLSIYLLTFIICFERDTWYRRWFWWPALALALYLLVELLFDEFHTSHRGLAEILAVYVFGLFAGCMFSHGELARSRSSVAQLTTFYLYVALGGALGGVFANILAPRLFNGYWELQVGLVATVLLVGLCYVRDSPLLRSKQARRWAVLSWMLPVGLMAALMLRQVESGRSHSILVTRGFFGVLSVDEINEGTPNHQRRLFHGAIQHGLQLVDPLIVGRPTSYFGYNSGVAAALRQHPRRRSSNPALRGLNIGVVGMGVGTLSAYGGEHDKMVYYEINPQVPTIAREYFSYLANGKAETSIELGDARLTLQQELATDGPRQFDVLVLDAFSGDSIPIHLLTREAFELYLQHLREDGVLAIHISNQFVDLAPVVRTVAERLGVAAMLVIDEGNRGYEDSNDWILMSANVRFFNTPSVQELRSEWPEESDRKIEWTDDFSNLFEVVDWGY